MNESNAAPYVVGISLLHAGQVVPAAMLTNIVRSTWNKSIVVWGGPHISGLGYNTLKTSLESRKFAADIFVVGHAENSFVDLLDHVSLRRLSIDNSPLIVDGRSTSTFSPTFDSLDEYDRQLVLPAQSTLGCSYGKCTYSTYPSIEPTPK